MWLRSLALLLVLPLVASAAGKQGKAEHVVVIVWDGMRPDLVSQENSPVLAGLARSGVFFQNHHAAYPSSTNVNGAVLAAGFEPGHTGIVANQEYRPEIDPSKPFDTADFQALDDPHRSGRYLARVTIAEVLQQAGHRSAIAGSKPVAQLFDWSRQRTTEAAKKSTVIFRGRFLPAELEQTVTAAIGPFPTGKSFPNDAEDEWTTRALTDVLWKEGVPKFSLLWLSEPDLSEHQTAPGSPIALSAIRSSDKNLARVLAALKAKGVLGRTDIFVVSDHGFSTVGPAVDVALLLHGAGLDAVRALPAKAKPGQILVVTLGGSVSFYVVGHDPAVIARLVAFLQASEFAGVILTRQEHTGTFTLRQAQIDAPSAPDVMLACRWNDQPNEFGIAGQIASDIGRTAGHGSHSSLSPHDLHNMLIASGPDFRHGWKDRMPSGNVDLAPTVLWLLGLQAPRLMDGRILREAFAGAHADPTVSEESLETQWDFGKQIWRQYLQRATVDGVTYLIEGNGRSAPAER